MAVKRCVKERRQDREGLEGVGGNCTTRQIYGGKEMTHHSRRAAVVIVERVATEMVAMGQHKGNFGVEKRKGQ